MFLRARKPIRLNWTVKIDKGHICLMEENLSLIMFSKLLILTWLIKVIPEERRELIIRYLLFYI
jgi:hypothetical protein